MRNVRRTLHLALASAAVACSQSGGSAPSTTAPATAVAMTATGTPAPSPAATSEESFTVQSEKFGDPEKAFVAAKNALLTKYYAAGLTDEDIYRAAVRGMVEDVDARMHKWNKLLSPSQLAEIETERSAQIVGIGVSINFDDSTGHIEVLGTMAGSPAEKAGLLAHDMIVSVNSKVFRGKAMLDAIHELRGKAGDPVSLSVLRDDKLLPFTITRAPVETHEVQHFVVDGVGELSVGMFTAKTVPAMRAALDDFSKANVRA